MKTTLWCAHLVFLALNIGILLGRGLESPAHADSSAPSDVYLIRVANQDMATSMKELPKIREELDKLTQEVAKTRDSCKK